MFKYSDVGDPQNLAKTRGHDWKKQYYFLPTKSFRGNKISEFEGTECYILREGNNLRLKEIQYFVRMK